MVTGVPGEKPRERARGVRGESRRRYHPALRIYTPLKTPFKQQKTTTKELITTTETISFVFAALTTRLSPGIIGLTWIIPISKSALPAGCTTSLDISIPALSLISVQLV